jgi:hypothetical protein
MLAFADKFDFGEEEIVAGGGGGCHVSWVGVEIVLKRFSHTP